jgi:hypothetical protein
MTAAQNFILFGLFKAFSLNFLIDLMLYDKKAGYLKYLSK